MLRKIATILSFSVVCLIHMLGMGGAGALADDIHGLTGTYYSSMDLTSPNFTRIDPAINFDWSSTGPGMGMNFVNYSVLWTGRITPSFSETWHY